jgi:SAM-dependent methyltransferase
VRVTSGPRRVARRLVDRAVEPYVQRILQHSPGSHPPTQPTPDVTDGGGDEPDSVVPSTDFHNLLHALRTSELRRLHGVAARVLSVGASGSWYFNWFEECVGHLEQHIGVEAFEEMPADLPPNVRWIASSAERFEGVESASIDMVFAGQTAEHLWSDELAAFLLESHRVLAPDGLLVLDSPNRLVTEHLAWSHGGHTVELSASELDELLALAGFHVRSTRGLWRCGFDGRVLELESGIDSPEWLVRRIAEAAEHVDESFVWWIVAVRAGNPDPDALRAATKAVYERHWPTRISRGMWPGPPARSLSLGPGTHLVSSLPVYLRAGVLSATIELHSGHLDDAADWRIRITTPGGHVVRTSALAEAATTARRRATWSLQLDEQLFAATIEIEVIDLRSDVDLCMPFGMQLDTL